MVWSLSRRKLVTSAVATVAAPVLLARTAAPTEPVLLRCSLETAPSHARNAVIRDYLGRIEAAAAGRIRTQLFENGQLFPDMQAGKASSKAGTNTVRRCARQGVVRGKGRRGVDLRSRERQAPAARARPNGSRVADCCGLEALAGPLRRA